MAYISNLDFPYSSLAWDLHNLGVFNNADMSLVMEAATSTQFFSPFSSSDPSTGYLQDALIEWSDRRKRSRLRFYADDQTKSSSDLLQCYWSSNFTQEPTGNFEYLNQTTDFNRNPDERLNCITSFGDGAPTMFSGIKTPEEALSGPETLNSSSTSDEKNTVKTRVDIHDKDTLVLRDATDYLGALECHGRKRKRVMTRVVYPFAVVKPGGVEGDVTLSDINERLLMAPTRPVKHPVGDFACRPCVSPDGPGLSGKAVVALTRIQTQGRGTITIIRTRG